MNQLKFFVTLFLFSILFLNTSCGGDDDDGNGISVGDGCTASWKVDGVDYDSDLQLCVYLDNTLNLSTNLTSSGSFVLQIDPITSTGTYTTDINSSTDVIILVQLTDGRRLASSMGSTVTVSELSSSKAKGTFSGDFYDLADLNLDPVFSVTNGSFSANF